MSEESIGKIELSDWFWEFNVHNDRKKDNLSKRIWNSSIPHSIWFQRGIHFSIIITWLLRMKNSPEHFTFRTNVLEDGKITFSREPILYIDKARQNTIVSACLRSNLSPTNQPRNVTSAQLTNNGGESRARAVLFSHPSLDSRVTNSPRLTYARYSSSRMVRVASLNGHVALATSILFCTTKTGLRLA